MTTVTQNGNGVNGVRINVRPCAYGHYVEIVDFEAGTLHIPHEDLLCREEAEALAADLEEQRWVEQCEEERVGYHESAYPWSY